MIIEDEYEDPEISDDIEFDDFDGTIVSPTARIGVKVAVNDPTQSTFASVLDCVAANNDHEAHQHLREVLKYHLYHNHLHYNRK